MATGIFAIANRKRTGHIHGSCAGDPRTDVGWLDERSLFGRQFAKTPFRKQRTKHGQQLVF